MSYLKDLFSFNDFLYFIYILIVIYILSPCEQ